MSTPAFDELFAGISRLYGADAASRLQKFHVCVIGIGGVGSWAAEALARSGVGEVTLIDNDEIALSNSNRQIHTTTQTVGKSKVIEMTERMLAINPSLKCHAINDFITVKTYEDYLSRGYDYVIDAIDSIKFKTIIIAYCHRAKIPVITTGGAGGLTDPTKIEITDLSKTFNDPLAAKVRRQLRDEHNFTRNPKRRFGIDCVFSTQQQVYPKEDGSVSQEKPGIHGVSLDCRFGYGASSVVTACFGFMAVSRVIEKYLARTGKSTN